MKGLTSHDKKMRMRPKIAAMFRNSFFIYYLTKFSSFLYNAISTSVFGAVMTSYDRLSDAFCSSLIVTKIKTLFGNRGRNSIKKAKYVAARTYENSYLLSGLRRLSRSFLLTHVNTLGLFLFSFASFSSRLLYCCFGRVKKP